MNPAEMVVAIVALVMIAVVFRARFAAHARSDPAPAATNEDTLRLAYEVQQLKERIQVLERVITDDRSTADLSHEIEQLRDR